MFNEKSFGYVDGRSAGLSRDLLAERGRYGPFSARHPPLGAYGLSHRHREVELAVLPARECESVLHALTLLGAPAAPPPWQARRGAAPPAHR